LPYVRTILMSLLTTNYLHYGLSEKRACSFLIYISVGISKPLTPPVNLLNVLKSWNNAKLMGASRSEQRNSWCMMNWWWYNKNIIEIRNARIICMRCLCHPIMHQFIVTSICKQISITSAESRPRLVIWWLISSSITLVDGFSIRISPGWLRPLRRCMHSLTRHACCLSSMTPDALRRHWRTWCPHQLVALPSYVVSHVLDYPTTVPKISSMRIRTNE
jgi:hypothetical protein